MLVSDMVVLNAQQKINEGQARKQVLQELKELIKTAISPSGRCPSCGKELNELGRHFGEYVWNCFDCNQVPNVRRVPLDERERRIVARARELCVR